MNATFRGVVRGGLVVLLEEEALLAEGTEVFVTPVAAAPGSAAAVLAAMATSPQPPGAWVDELEQLIAQGRRRPERKNSFSDQPDSKNANL